MQKKHPGFLVKRSKNDWNSFRLLFQVREGKLEKGKKLWENCNNYRKNVVKSPLLLCLCGMLTGNVYRCQNLHPEM